MSMPGAPASRAEPNRRRKRSFRRLLSIPVVAVAAAGVLAVNVPTVGAAVASWYHHYEITRPAYEAKYGLWDKLDIPQKFRVNGIHATLLHNGDVLIMAGSGNNQAFFNAGTFKTLLLNPVTMQMRLIHTPWDLFCAGHVELPDGNILIAGGTARYEDLKPTHAGGSMTVVNRDTGQAWRLPKGTIFTAPGGARFASAFAMRIPRARTVVGAAGQLTVIPGQQNVWVDAVRKGRGSLVASIKRYHVQGLLGPQANRLLYGIGSPMTLSKQNFLGTNDAYIFDVKTSSYVEVNSMNYARWYPTLAEMGNGMIMAMSGLNNVGQITMNSEMFNPVTKKWTVGPVRGFPTYPATFLTENGQLFFTGSNAGYGPSTPAWRTPGFWNVRTNKFRAVPGIPSPQNLETSGSVLLPPGPEADDHGSGWRWRWPVTDVHRAHRAHRYGRAQPALGARAEPGPADPLPQHRPAARRPGPGDRGVALLPRHARQRQPRYPALQRGDQLVLLGGQLDHRPGLPLRRDPAAQWERAYPGRESAVRQQAGHRAADLQPGDRRLFPAVHVPRAASAGRLCARGHEATAQLHHQGDPGVEHPVSAPDAARQSHARDRRQSALDRGEIRSGRPG